MSRPRVVLVVAGFMIGYLAKEPSFTTVLGIVLVSCLALGLIHLWSEQPVAVEDGPRELDHLEYEISRARRFERELGLVVVRPIAGEMQPATRQSVILAVGTRRIDRAWMEGGILCLLLPETDQDGAAIVARRIEAAVAPGSIRTASAVFPIDAVTSEGLIQAAMGGLEGAEPVRPMRPADSVN
jgi:hypothetical protein